MILRLNKRNGISGFNLEDLRKIPNSPEGSGAGVMFRVQTVGFYFTVPFIESRITKPSADCLNRQKEYLPTGYLKF